MKWVKVNSSLFEITKGGEYPIIRGLSSAYRNPQFFAIQKRLNHNKVN
jgi:hypothetical protein